MKKRKRKPRPKAPPKPKIPIPARPRVDKIGNKVAVGSWLWLVARHNHGYRPISVSALRDSYQHVGWRKWGKWREIAGIPHRAQLISEKSALILSVLAASGGKATEQECIDYIKGAAKASPNAIVKILEGLGWRVDQGAKDMMAAINGINPAIDVIYRQRLYEWFRRIGLKYSARDTYSYHQVRDVADEALKGVGLGRRRRSDNRPYSPAQPGTRRSAQASDELFLCAA